MNNSRYGIYPGKLKYDVKYINNCSEIELFNQLNSYYSYLKSIEYLENMKKFYTECDDKELALYFNNLLNEKINLRKDELKEYEYTLDYCMLQTKRFGVDISYNPNGRVIETDSFKNWLTRWNNYINTMDQDTLMIYRNCRYEGKNLEYFEAEKTASIENFYDIYFEKISEPAKTKKKSIKFTA